MEWDIPGSVQLPQASGAQQAPLVLLKQPAYDETTQLS